MRHIAAPPSGDSSLLLWTLDLKMAGDEAMAICIPVRKIKSRTRLADSPALDGDSGSDRSLFACEWVVGDGFADRAAGGFDRRHGVK